MRRFGLRFRLRTGSAGLFEDKWRCRMCIDGRYVLCNRGEVEDVGHFVLSCGEFTAERRKLVRKIRSLVGAERSGEEYDRGNERWRCC